MTGGERSGLAWLFSEALKQPIGSRDGWLEAASPDPATRAEVQALLRVYDEDPGFLEAPLDAAVAAAQIVEAREALQAEGRRLGPYRLVREVGRGGMGVVYEAARDDAEFERRVAIKLLPAALASAALDERFRFERQVLAGLDHPNIARLFDAGSSDDGIPYLVMEFVDGEPIDAWCRDRQLDLRARVQVVLAVCAAVAHAHQHLVVHRDLKPANILVNPDGQPKLLDFGIATLVSEHGRSVGTTRTGQHSFTPEYASPEQVRGERVTTASDIYSLGVLLYLILAGRPPHQLTGLAPLDAMRAICEIDPPPPSRVAPAFEQPLLRGDLDAIVLKALRKDPAERYRSVFDLEGELRAWLDGRPVAARAASHAYRARKFVGRHRVSVAAAAVAVAAVLGGGGVAVWQARAAALQRDRAENRFREVRQFSRSLLFEVHESLRALPGATEPRRLLLDRAVQFLDGLAADAGNDDDLLIELGEGYRRLGHVQGSVVSANLGDRAGAIASFEKAARLGDAVVARQPASVAALNVATGAYDDLSSALLSLGRHDEAERAYERHLALTVPLEQQAATDPAARASLASSLLNLGTFRTTRRDLPGSRPFYERAVALFESLPPDYQARDGNVSAHSFALKRLGSVLLASGHLDDGERRFRAALSLDEQLVARNPGNAGYEYDLTFSLTDLALAKSQRGDRLAAVELLSRALTIREAALAADPRNVRAMQGVARVHLQLLAAMRGLGRHDAEVSHGRAAVRLQEDLVQVLARPAGSRPALAEARIELATALLNLAATPAAGRAAPTLRAEADRLLDAAAAEVALQPPGAGGDPSALGTAIDTQRARRRS